MGGFLDQAVATLLVSLRIMPTLGFAPPFTLVRVPATVRLLLGIALSGWLVTSHPAGILQTPNWERGLPIVVASELLMGIALALALQLAFAGLQTAGRVIDIQAGFGLMTLVDPTTRSQTPLAGTLFAYVAAALFFSSGGGHDLLAVWAASLDRVPIGAGHPAQDPSLLIAYMASAFLLAFGAAGIVLLVLFLLDLAIAFLSRTLPQMNVLVMGFQVKAIATLMMLPVALASSGALFLRLLRYALDTSAQIG